MTWEQIVVGTWFVAMLVIGAHGLYVLYESNERTLPGAGWLVALVLSSYFVVAAVLHHGGFW